MKVLVFTPHGSVHLLASKAKNAEVLWSSDDDEAFAEEFEDVIDPNSQEEVDQLMDYLCEAEELEDGEQIEIEEQYFDESDRDDDDDGEGGIDPSDRWDPSAVLEQ